MPTAYIILWITFRVNMFANRLFTAAEDESLCSVHYVTVPAENSEGRSVVVEIPENWNPEAAGTIADALLHSIPSRLQYIEETSLPSWLWKRKPASHDLTAETGARQVFERIVGSAAHAGWKKGLWKNEEEARSFHDEVLFMLAGRIIALDTELMASAGIEWAYGLRENTDYGRPGRQIQDAGETIRTVTRKPVSMSLKNEAIDSITRDADSPFMPRWQKFLRGGRASRMLLLNFSGTVSEWCPVAGGEEAPRLMLDLFRFRKDDGAIDLALLRHAIRLSVLLLELHYENCRTRSNPARPVSIGYCNLGALLVSLALPYDSPEGRATAAAISAVITAEAVIASAGIAERFGPCLGFLARREECLRRLRNHRNAAYGECSDYERLSILPAPLFVEDGADLVLVAAARRAWDDALKAAYKGGLRHLQLTSLFESPQFAALLDCSSQGLEPETRFVRQYALSSGGDGGFRRAIHPAVPMALEKTGGMAAMERVVDHAVGRGTLREAPGVNHTLLRERGFDEEALARVERYLPGVNDIRTAFTPWILGEKFCRETLKIAAANLFDPRFDILRHLGFSECDIAAANAWCCGHGEVLGAGGLPERAARVFSPDNASPEARLRMASAVQSFIMGDVNLVLPLPMQTSAETRADLFLSGWRQGLKSMKLYFEGFSRQARAVLRPAAGRQEKFVKRRFSAPAPALDSLRLLAARAKIPAQIVSPRSSKPKAPAQAAGIARRSRKAGMRTRIETKGD